PDQVASIEETGYALEALVGAASHSSLQVAIEQGLAFLVQAVEEDRHREPSPIGLYFAKLWYHEHLYPYISTVSALGQAIAADHPQPGSTETSAHEFAGH
ncbi:MAG: hypothetical protein KDA42_19255, partial [Planctomycetales bacterium]|nr:hypothetical protein [Planctomycetales bacterium]